MELAAEDTVFMQRLVSVGLLCLLLGGCRSSRPMPPPLSPAVFSPDGTAIIFSMARGDRCFLYSADIATGAMKRLTKAMDGCETDPAFSPDGQMLAFMRAPRSGERSALVIAKIDGTAERILMSNKDDNLQPAFVPKSNLVLFLRSGAFEHYSPLVNNRRHKFDLFAVDLSSGTVKALTDKQYYEISQLSVSPDGTQVALSVYDDGGHFLILPLKNPQASVRSLQPTVPNAPTPQPIIYNALWFPDGRSLLFSAATQLHGESNYRYNVYRLDISSGAIDRLTDLTGTIEGLSLSADGKKAVLLHNGGYYLLDVNSYQLAPIPLRNFE
jgi:Tol biopolymer transport system component